MQIYKHRFSIGKSANTMPQISVRDTGARPASINSTHASFRTAEQRSHISPMPIAGFGF